MKTLLLLFPLLALTPSASLVEEYFDALEKFSTDTDGEALMLSSSTPASQKEHFLAFKNYKREVDTINADPDCPYHAEINKFSIMTEQERMQFTGLNITDAPVPEEEEVEEMTVSMVSAPSYINWVSRNAQPTIKNQGGCGSCWAFAAVSAMEGTYYTTTGDLVAFSDQEVLDCTYEGSRNGCSGGWLNAPIDYVRKAGRLASVTQAPYKGRDGACSYRTKGNSLTKAKITGYTTTRNDASLQDAVTKGVVSVAIYVGSSFFKYQNGLYKDTNVCKTTTSPNHAVTVVGYGTQGGVGYWRVRNSWGSNWGAKGYVLMSRAVRDNCRISSYGYLAKATCSGNKCNKPDFNDNENEKEEKEEEKEEEKVECEDRNSRCNRYKTYCVKNGRYYNWMLKNCANTCKWCEGNGTPEDECPSGTVMCGDGVCRHEHMC